MVVLRIWVHLVWHTHKTAVFADTLPLVLLFEHIKSYAATKDIHVDTVGGYTDHVHCLVSLNANQNIATVVNYLKGESSFWINKSHLVPEKFSWEDGYLAFSVGSSVLNKTRDFINNQIVYHQNTSTNQEMKLLAKKYNFDFD